MSEELVTLHIDVKEEDVPAIISMGLRLATLQGIFNVSYMEIYDALEEKYEYRKVIPTKGE